MTPFDRGFNGPPLWFLIPFGIIFVLIAGTALFGIGFAIYKAITTSARNAQSPMLEREAKVVGRRQHVWGESTRTDYYVTFELVDGTRQELKMNGEQYGVLVEGDQGILHNQGTAYKGFDRTRASS